jgi:hypothetical protein
MPAIIQLQTIGGLLIERVDNGYIVREASYASGMGECRPVRVAETPKTLLELVEEWTSSHWQKVTPAA